MPIRTASVSRETIPTVQTSREHTGGWPFGKYSITPPRRRKECNLVEGSPFYLSPQPGHLITGWEMETGTVFLQFKESTTSTPIKDIPVVGPHLGALLCPRLSAIQPLSTTLPTITLQMLYSSELQLLYSTFCRCLCATEIQEATPFPFIGSIQALDSGMRGEGSSWSIKYLTSISVNGSFCRDSLSRCPRSPRTSNYPASIKYCTYWRFSTAF